MKNLICISAAFLFAFNTATAQKTVNSSWSWENAAVKMQTEYFQKYNSQERYFDMPGLGAARAGVFEGAEKMSGSELGTCSSYCLVSKDGSIPCELIAEDHCPMRGYSRFHENQPANIELKDSGVIDHWSPPGGLSKRDSNF